MSTDNGLIGRVKEQLIIKDCIDSGSPEFIAIYGRRRVGKTFLVKSFFNDEFDFYISGVYGISKQQQLKIFNEQLSTYSGEKKQTPKNWFEAFNYLKEYLGGLDKEHWIVFIDELPWMDSPKSNFLRALEAFWNMWGTNHKQLKLIVCGSATTWMTNKLLADKGGLHNRVTKRIHLYPFSLKETEDFLLSKGIDWGRMQILQCYMAMGGIPYYLGMTNKRESVVQNIDRLFFGTDAELREEYGFVFNSLFNEGTMYKRVVELLAKKMMGMTRKDILQHFKMTSSGSITEVLENLCRCDFVRAYNSFGKKKQETLYQLSDFYILFYLRFGTNKGLNPHVWRDMKDQIKSNWYGYAFEQVCLYHTEQIKHSLGIDGIYADVSSWKYKPTGKEEKGAQIDLVINRADNVVNLCEMKYSAAPYEITSEYADKLIERREIFRKVTKSKDTLHITFVTTNGVKRGKYYECINNEVTLDDLFWDYK